MIKTKLLTILSICLIMGSSTSLAGERTEREMLAIARQQLNKAAMARASQPVATGIEKLVDQQQCCIYGQEDAGFVVVSRNDELMPVLGYSTTTFNSKNMPDDLILPLHLTRVSESTFAGTNIHSVDISGYTETIENNAFSNCQELTNVKIGKYVEPYQENGRDTHSGQGHFKPA